MEDVFERNGMVIHCVLDVRNNEEYCVVS